MQEDDSFGLQAEVASYERPDRALGAKHGHTKPLPFHHTRAGPRKWPISVECSPAKKGRRLMRRPSGPTLNSQSSRGAFPLPESYPAGAPTQKRGISHRDPPSRPPRIPSSESRSHRHPSPQAPRRRPRRVHPGSSSPTSRHR